jgi:hypothetical protein
MVTRTLIDKSTTIKKGSDENFGMNTVCMLNYGTGVSRALIHFDVEALKTKVEDKTYPDLSKLTHRLMFKNCASVDFKNNRQLLPAGDWNGAKERAVSFTLIALKVSKDWDMGVGADNTNDFWVTGKSAVSYDAATWYNATTAEQWDDDGIYPDSYIESEYDAYLNGSTDTIIVGVQKFDVGNENLSMDVTEYVNKLITGAEDNYGICIMFEPYLETVARPTGQYVGFFNEKTNTAFVPVLETRYDAEVNDNRFDFHIGKMNRLYMYSVIGGKFENLDEMPQCFINGTEYQVKQATKGIYYIEVKFAGNSYPANTILYDNWTNFYYQGDAIEDEEMEFVIKSQKTFFDLDETVRQPKILNPILVGIDDNEKIVQGERRLMKMWFKVPYTHSDYLLNESAEYRLYMKDGERDITVIDWDKAFNISKCNLFTIETATLPPSRYHIDIRASFGEELRVFKDKTVFDVVSDATDEKI